MTEDHLWPTVVQAQILRACFGNDAEALQAREACEATPPDCELDANSVRLLPLFFRRWSTVAGGGDFLERSRRVHLTVWARSQRRRVCLNSVISEFDNAGIETMLLKGAALALAHYDDAGLRDMDDFDLLIHQRDIEAAARVLKDGGWKTNDSGWRSTEDPHPAKLARRMRVHHAWHFYRGPEENCDLHCLRPVPCCYSPTIAEMFWAAADTVPLCGQVVKVPCPTDQLFHACIHGLRWHYPPKAYWIADALTLLRRPGSIDWDRMDRLAFEGDMRDGIYEGLHYLRAEWDAPIPQDYLTRWASGQWSERERREHRRLVNPSLRVLDTAARHVSRFYRIRPYDAAWRRLPAFLAFPQYLYAWWTVHGWADILHTMWSSARSDSATSGHRHL